MDIDIVDYNNKSRKGRYIIVKHEKQRRTYKYDEEYPLDFYIDVANRSMQLNKSKKGARPNKKKIMVELNRVREGNESKYLREMGMKYDKYKGIKKNKYLKTGQTSVKVELSRLQADPMKYYKKLLSPLVLDKELLKIVVQNADKFKHRFWYYAENNGIILNKKSGERKEEKLSYHEDSIKTPLDLLGQYTPRFKKNRILNGGQMRELIKEVGGINERFYLNDSKQRVMIKNTMITITFTKGNKPKPTIMKNL